MALDKNATHYFAIVVRAKIEEILTIQEFVDKMDGVNAEVMRTDDKRLIIVNEKEGEM